MQELAREFGKPFVHVHHLEAHCMMARLAGKEILPEGEGSRERSSEGSREGVSSNSNSNSHSSGSSSSSSSSSSGSGSNNGNEASTSALPKVEYPFLALLASGGHTSILLCQNLGEYSVLGGTLDDALGEAFDKASRMLGLRSASSGGAAVEAAALKGTKREEYGMTIPMRNKPNCDFSYAGLKNAFRVAVQRAREAEGLDRECTNAPKSQMEESPEMVALSPAAAADLCATFQDVAFGHLVSGGL